MNATNTLKYFCDSGIDQIPSKLRKLPQAVTWVAGSPDPVTKKFSKFPRGRDGSGAAWQTPPQWLGNLDAAIVRAHERGHAGPGVVLPAQIDGQHLVALDWDGVDFDDVGRMGEIIQDWEALGRPYMEVSPSGKGLRAFVLSQASRKDISRSRPGGGKDELFCASRGRWMTITGNVYKPGGLPDATDAVAELCLRWSAGKTKPAVASRPHVKKTELIPTKPSMFSHLLGGVRFAWPEKPLEDGGGRELNMLRFAHSLRGQGYPQAEIEAECLKARTERYAPGCELTEAAVLDRARRGMKSTEEENNDPQVKSRAITEVLLSDIGECLNDAGNSDRFVMAWGENVRYVPELKAWLLWREGHWRFDHTGAIIDMAKVIARSLYTEAANTKNQATRGSIARWANSSLQITRLKAMIELAQPALAVSVTRLDADPWLLGVQNGAVNLRTGEFREAEQGDLITKLANVSYDPDATCTNWAVFLQSCMAGNKDLMDLLQLAGGYSLTGLTSEQVFFFLYGTGANGKSTFVNALREIMGANGMQSQSETIMAQRTVSASGPTPEIARLAGVRFVAMVETEDGQRLAESRLKQLTGGDAMTARILHGNQFDFVPVLKLWLSGNHKPVIRGDDLGIWRRIVLIPFEVAVAAEQRDKKLASKLRAEYPGILNWLIRGCLNWQKTGLLIPPEVSKQVDQYKSSMDLLGQWLTDRCVNNPQEKYQARAAYESFARWCKEGGHLPISEVRFSQKMAERSHKHETTRGGKFYIGLAAVQSELTLRLGW